MRRIECAPRATLVQLRALVLPSSCSPITAPSSDSPQYTARIGSHYVWLELVEDRELRGIGVIELCLELVPAAYD